MSTYRYTANDIGTVLARSAVGRDHVRATLGELVEVFAIPAAEALDLGVVADDADEVSRTLIYKAFEPDAGEFVKGLGLLNDPRLGVCAPGVAVAIDPATRNLVVTEAAT